MDPFILSNAINSFQNTRINPSVTTYKHFAPQFTKFTSY